MSDFGVISRADLRLSRRNHRAAALIWLIGATVYLVCEAIAAARVPDYSYVDDYISDLGVSTVMNVGFMVHGSLFLLGAFLVVRGCPSEWGGRAFVMAAAANALGNVVVGAFRSGSHWHVVGAGLAIVGGNVAVIIAGFVSRRRWSIALGVVGLACLLALLVAGSRFPVGVVERGSVYPIVVWEIGAGVVLLRRGRCSRR
jgi:hypothetical membrane protein